MAPKRKRATPSPKKPQIRATRSTTSTGQTRLNASAENPEPRKRRKIAAAADLAIVLLPSPASASASDAARTICIEHCKQTRSFKTKATQVSKLVKKAVPDVNVSVNPTELRKGCFEVREEGGDVFLSLLNLKAPFKALKDLNVKNLVADIVDKLGTHSHDLQDA